MNTLQNNTYYMNYDIKNILIIIFFGCTLFFGYSWYFKGDDGSAERAKALETQFVQLKIGKEKSDKKIIELKSKFDIIRKEDAILKSRVVELSAKTASAELAAAKSKAELESSRRKINKIRESIHSIEKTPVNRTGADLIQSLKTKLK